MHAVTQAGNSAFTYTHDGNGNVTSRNGYSITWTSYDHPSAINGVGSEQVQFAYNHEHLRGRAAYSGAAGAETTYFIGDLLEKVVTAGAQDYRHFIKVGDTRSRFTVEPMLVWRDPGAPARALWG